MTNSELEILQEIANKLLTLCATAELKNQESCRQAELARARFLLLSGDRSSPNDVVSKLNTEKKSIDEIFTKKEISQMPKLKDLSYSYRYSDGIHEFRYRKNKLSKSFSSRDYKEAKRKAMEFVKELNGAETLFGNKRFVSFNDFTESYLITVKRANVTEKTFDVMYNRYKKHILPAFSGKNLSGIKAPFIQAFLNGIIEQGFNRTAEDCFYILKTTFQYAVDNDVIEKSPMRAVKIPTHRRKNGVALPLDVERKFVSFIKGSPYELTFLVLLYAGCRPCELNSLSIEKNGFLTFRNRKQHHGAIVFKDIPITPMLEPYVERIKENLPLKNTTELAKIFSRNVPGFRLYDLRHTFASRCQECGVPQEVVSRWLGHKSDKITDAVYTHFSQNYMLELAKKVEY